ncbi:MAG TPA: serine hydrolase [Methylomirabilota bacterium]|nr:serine hydrolase [Methylomirabilota bacterium]
MGKNKIRLPKSRRLTLVRPAVARPEVRATPRVMPAPASSRLSEDVAAYHGRTGAEHQAEFDRLSRHGFRIVALCVYGDAANPRYAAVWHKRSGPAWTAVHGVNAHQFQAFAEQKAAQGFVPTAISATGPSASAVFAGVFEKAPHANGWLAKTGLTAGPATDPTTFNFFNKWAQENGFILRSACIYGGISDRRYAAVWAPNTSQARWVCRTADTSGDYQKWLDAYTQMAFRPSCVALTNDQLYLSCFRDDSIGEWVARHGLTADGYQAEFNTRIAQGLYPIAVQAGGTGNNSRYAVIFARQEQPLARQWTVTGSRVTPTLARFDEIMREFMTSNAVRAGSLAIARNGVIKLAHGYTWAEPGYPVTQPNSPFRLASLSKAFTCAAIKSLYDAKKISPHTAIFPFLGIITKALPSQGLDPRINTITVQQLVDHMGGWDREVYPDPVFHMRNVARALGLNTPPAKRDLARFMFGEPLQFAPGTNSKYCNFGYVLLSLAIEQASGQRYIDYLRQAVLAPLGITDVFLARSLKIQRLANEGFYEHNAVGVTPLNPTQEVLAPYAYGGEGWLTESMDASGGLAATPSAVVKFIHAHAVWGLGERAPGTARSGGMAGTSSLAVSRPDGVDYCYVFNTREISSAAQLQLAESLRRQLDTISW